MIMPSSVALERIANVVGPRGVLSAADAQLPRDERGLDRGAAGKLS